MVGRAETWKGSWRLLSVSEECSSRAERGPELVIKEKCRRLGGSGREKIDQWCHSPQACCYETGLGLYLFPEQTFAACHGGIRTKQVSAAENPKGSFIFNNLTLHPCTCCGSYVSSPNTSHTSLLAYRIKSYVHLDYLECNILWQNKAKGRKLIMKACKSVRGLCTLHTHKSLMEGLRWLK